jgi:hypothetical protein
VLSNLMIESLDLEVGRLLVETGLAQRGDDGRLVYRPDATDTMVIILGDNGSLGSTVKVPFNPERAKGTAYQTGVWVPLIVSGPLVEGAPSATWSTSPTCSRSSARSPASPTCRRACRGRSTPSRCCRT